jgi:hypothetical protein
MKSQRTDHLPAKLAKLEFLKNTGSVEESIYLIETFRVL